MDLDLFDNRFLDSVGGGRCDFYLLHYENIFKSIYLNKTYLNNNRLPLRQTLIT